MLRLVTGEDGEELDPGELEGGPKTGVKVECQMETSKQKTVTFEFSTTTIVPGAVGGHHEPAQLTLNTDRLPHVSFPPE